jgi:hypothetical protein
MAMVWQGPDAAAVLPHTSLSVYWDDGHVFVAPNGSAVKETLSVDLATGSVQLLSTPAPQAGVHVGALTVLGLSKLHKGGSGSPVGPATQWCWVCGRASCCCGVRGGGEGAGPLLPP